jgi:hypothetical protein
MAGDNTIRATIEPANPLISQNDVSVQLLDSDDRSHYASAISEVWAVSAT